MIRKHYTPENNIQHETLVRLERIEEVRPRLTNFAQSRLMRLGMPAWLAEDMVASAIERVVVGASGSREDGRRPRPQDLASDATWANYLRGAINSIIEKCSRSHRRSVVKQAISFEETTILESSVSTSVYGVESEVERNDLREVFFARLRLLAGPHLQPTLDAWEQVFWESDQIPTLTRQDHRELQILAREVWEGIDREFEI